MRVLVFADSSVETGKSLFTVVEEVAKDTEMQIFDDFTSLSRRLQLPGGNNNGSIVILLAQSREELKAFKELLGRFLSDYRIILILPDRELDTISLGHQLRPRYFSYADCDYSEIGYVLENMLKNMGSPRV